MIRFWPANQEPRVAEVVGGDRKVSQHEVNLRLSDSDRNVRPHAPAHAFACSGNNGGR